MHCQPLYTDEQIEFCRKLPKVERHAHINGSIRRATLEELYENLQNDKKTSANAVNIISGDTRSLSEMFEVFSIVHRVVRGADLLARVTREILEDMHADGVVYAELRTTPREHLDAGLDRRAYVDAVLQGIESHRRRSKGNVFCVARLVLCIDRKDSVEVAEEAVDLAIEFKDRGVVGLDLCGDPARGWGRWKHDWQPAFERARRDADLKVTLHAAEMAGMEEELASMLAWRPDSLGHLCYVPRDLEKRIFESGIPVEICLSSNLLSNSVESYSAHHMSRYLDRGHPLAICTDDVLVFGSPLSREYAIAMSTFHLDQDQILQLARSALQTSFLETGPDYDNVYALLNAAR